MCPNLPIRIEWSLVDQRACKFINVNLDRRPRPGLGFVCDLCMDGNV